MESSTVHQEHPVVEPQVSHLRHVPFLTKVKLAHSPHGSPTYPFALASARAANFDSSDEKPILIGDSVSLPDGAAAAAAPARLHCRASSFSVGERSCWASCFSATAPSRASAAREEERAVIVEATPPRLTSFADPPPAGEGEEPRASLPPRTTTRLSVRERVRPFDTYLVECEGSGCLPSSTPLPSASKLLSLGSTWARSKRPM